MSPEFTVWALMTASTASCLVAGVFLSFSDFTMRSLRLASPEAGSQAMQILNREVFRSIFIVLLIGMSVVSAVIGVTAYFAPPTVASTLIIVGSLCYVLGVLLVTMLGNVPKNNSLAAFSDGGRDAQEYWPTYYRGWMFWNHIRTFFSFITAVIYIIAAVQIALSI